MDGKALAGKLRELNRSTMSIQQLAKWCLFWRKSAPQCVPRPAGVEVGPPALRRVLGGRRTRGGRAAGRPAGPPAAGPAPRPPKLAGRLPGGRDAGGGGGPRQPPVRGGAAAVQRRPGLGLPGPRARDPGGGRDGAPVGLGGP